MELSDAGILVAGGRPARVLASDQNALASPGYALPRKKEVLTGRAAERLAQLFPQQTLDRFWDQLSTEPLARRAKGIRNQAEVAFVHLKRIWDRVKSFGDSMVIAVPDHYTRSQLGLLLGMAQELDIRVHGFYPISVAAVSGPEPGEMLLYLDIHLHRMELSCLQQTEQLQHVDSITLPGKGLRYWHRQWVEAIAAEFVHTTRFDPLHRAESEQDLYNRLTAIAADLKNRTSARIELPAGETTYRSTISSEQLIRRNTDALNEVCRAIRRMQERRTSAPDTLPTLLVSHRIACLPGVRRSLSENLGMRVKALPEGAAALGAHALWDDSGERQLSPETVFRKSRPWVPRTTETAPTDQEQVSMPPPSHLLNGAVAYPLKQHPLFVTRHGASGQIQILMPSGPFSAGDSHCMILRRGDFFYLEAVGMPGATLNGRPVSGDIPLKPGDRIRLGDDDGETLKIISCL
jgi:hypothetical protein